jgi:hypothetical protein
MSPQSRTSEEGWGTRGGSVKCRKETERIREKKCHDVTWKLPHTSARESIGIVDQRLNGQENYADVDRLSGHVSLLF